MTGPGGPVTHDKAGGIVEVPTSMAGQRLVDVCWTLLGGVARRAIGPTIADGGITVDGRTAAIADPVGAGQRLALTPAGLDRLTRAGRVIPPSNQPLLIVHEDHDVLVVDKPAGLHVHPMGPHRDDTLLGRVLWHAGARPGWPWTSFRPAPAHRLDRPTSGLVVFARTIAARGRLQDLLDDHDVERGYTAVVEGVVAEDAGLVDEPLGVDPTSPRRRAVLAVADGGQRARSRWRVIARGTDRTRLALRLETGRTHQLRAHLAHLGHPIVGDHLYGADPVGGPPDPALGSAIALRATSLHIPAGPGHTAVHLDVGDDDGLDPWRLNQPGDPPPRMAD